MARLQKNKNSLLPDLSGHIGKHFVIKQYGNRVVVSNYPDMSKVKRTRKQKQEQSRFQQAVSFARGVLADPKKKKAYARKAKKGQTVYHAAISAFMNGKV